MGVLQASPRAPPPRAPGGPGDQALWVSSLPPPRGPGLRVPAAPEGGRGRCGSSRRSPQGVFPRERCPWDLGPWEEAGICSQSPVLSSSPSGEGVPARLGSLSGLQAGVVRGLRRQAISGCGRCTGRPGARSRPPPTPWLVSEGAAVRPPSGQRARNRLTPAPGIATRRPPHRVPSAKVFVPPHSATQCFSSLTSPPAPSPKSSRTLLSGAPPAADPP